jgi:hypothetical protein
VTTRIRRLGRHLSSKFDVGCTKTLGRWIKYNLDTGKAISIQNLGSISLQIYNEDSIIYFNLYDTFLMETGLNYDRVLSMIF